MTKPTAKKPTTTAKPNGLVGMYFISHSDSVLLSGFVSQKVEPGVYLLDLFNWAIGFRADEYQLMNIGSMYHWDFYDTQDAFAYHLKNHVEIRRAFDKKN